VEGARPATAGDLPRLVELCRAARAELAAHERGGPLFLLHEARPEPIEESLAAATADPDQQVVVGTIDEHPMGYGTGRVETLPDGSRLGIIDDLFVEEGARAVGVGEAVMNALLPWFRERGCLGVDATALPGARATKNFFEETGFTARLLIMHHRFRDVST
jgi:GNAT superfamily N-acetyltransferase